jgi:hypothetical protein
MKKLILSSLALLGFSVAFSAPAEAQVIISSPPAGGSITGASSFTNLNGSTSAIAGQVTFPTGVYAQKVRVRNTTRLGAAAAGDVVLTGLTVDQGNGVTATPLPGTTTTSVEAAVATLINAGTGGLNGQVSLIRAWRSGLD